MITYVRLVEEKAGLVRASLPGISLADRDNEVLLRDVDLGIANPHTLWD